MVQLQTTENANRVYSYDSGDIFIDSTGNEGVEITMASFEGKIGRATNSGHVYPGDCLRR